MLTGDIKAKIDKIWNTFWSGGISNPLSVIEQISFLLFIKRLDDIHTAKEKKANRLNKPIEEPIFAAGQENLRWSRFKEFEAEQMFKTVSQEVFPFIKNLHGGEDTAYSRHMKDAIFMIPTPSLLERVVEQISDVPMEDRDTKGDLYEYMLSKLTTAGTNGQFRTPRHIIKMMVELMQPKPEDTICDPACGTAGFLVAAGEYLREQHPDLFHNEALKRHFNEKLFNGFDFDSTMLRIASMNMMLHGIENPAIERRDALANSAADIADAFTLILANPPFKGSLDDETVAKDLLRTVKTKKTELLFIALMLRLLKPGGRCAVIVPDGVLFGSSKAHLDLRKTLLEGHKLEAMISMPSGVFRPYAGVSTGILIFTKTNSGGTDHVWFYDMQADGYSLDDKRNPMEQNDIPDVLEKWHSRSVGAGPCACPNLGDHMGPSLQTDRTAKSFCVPLQEIRDNKYDLSINRYKQVEHEEVEYEPPQVIIARLEALEQEIAAELAELKGMVG